MMLLSAANAAIQLLAVCQSIAMLCNVANEHSYSIAAPSLASLSDNFQNSFSVNENEIIAILISSVTKFIL